MLTQTALERYLEIQYQILDKKITDLQNYPVTPGMVKDFKIKVLRLERRKNRLMLRYQKIKNSGTKSYDSLLNIINHELKEICQLYNRLFSQLESSQ